MSHQNATRIPMSRVDRLWLGSTVVNAVGPIEIPDRAAIVAAFVAFGSAGPQARVGLRFAPDSDRHWLYRVDDLPAYADSCVVELEPGADDDLDALMGRLGRDHSTNRPTRIFLADRHVLSVVSHAIGDSRLLMSLPAAVVAYTRSETLPEWARTADDPHPLRSGLRRTFPGPASVSAMLAERRVSRKIGAGLVSGDRAHDDTARDDTVSFRPHPVSVTVPGAPGGTQELRTWTARNLPGAAHFATVLTTVEQAFSEHGIACEPGVHMMFDLRRYLPRAKRATGNFVGGLDLPTPVQNPRTVTSAVTRAAKSGRPLAAILASVVLSEVSRVPGFRPAPSTRVPAAPRARLALSYVLPTKVPDELSWSGDPDDRIYSCRVDPAGPTAITLLVGLIGTRMQLAACFHDTVFDAAAVRSALQSVHDDPIGLLQRAGLRQNAPHPSRT